MSVAQLAQLVGVARTTMYDYLSGKKRPRKFMARIVEISAGKVQPNDFYKVGLPISVAKRNVKSNPNKHGALG